MQRTSAAMPAMKHASVGFALILLLAVVHVPQPALAAQLTSQQAMPAVDQVVELIRQLQARVQADGKLEQQSYDKYACWCQETMARKAKDISDGQEQIADLQAHLVKVKAEIASHDAEIQQVKADIAANIDSRREATEVRDKENAGYVDDKTESEQCTGALEAAIKVLTGAGEKKGFLETMQEAKLLSAVAGVRDVLVRPKVSKSMSMADLDVVKRFVEKPEAFVGSRGVSAAQVGNNPFGDYAPQSTQIQGILKGMYDTFVSDIEKSNADEAEAQKAFEALMATKLKEAETLQATLNQQELDRAEKSKDEAQSKEILDETKVQLDADEEFLATTKSNCKIKADEWSTRTRLRTEELQGIGKCIQILANSESRKIFQNSSTTLLQLSSQISPKTALGKGRLQAFSTLKSLATRFKNTRMAHIALQLKAAGHFDKVMAAMDSMIDLLRKEEQEDIEHRDRCQASENKNTNDMEDLSHDINKATTKIGALEGEIEQLDAAIEALEDEIGQTRQARADRLQLRNEEEAEFRQAMKDDADAVALLDEAMLAMKEFYRRNKLPLSFRALPAEPKYSGDRDKAPETTWSGSNYGGRKSETEGLVAIMEMIKEDVQKEMQTARFDDSEAQKLYLKEDGEMKEALDTQIASKLSHERELADIKGEKFDTEEHKASKKGDLTSEETLKSALYTDCSWVATHFESRRTKRKAEIDGLQEAKSYLAGVESGDAV
mmetsp:Transcript_130269/g.324812  ORF Transcript_130269/g.324812 Transcript_130269/m.324812 type:complete len:723 (+) Transcript_130269:34-2202(+)